VKILLDSHVLLWALADSPRLSKAARALLADEHNECWVSSVSVWEIAIKTVLGKYRLGQPLATLGETIERSGFRTLNVTPRHAVAIENVTVTTADPFDRLLLAQCEVETLRLLTADRHLSALPVALKA
jgi:PIN domain nuclease of toxin-antitoxin system